MNAFMTSIDTKVLGRKTYEVSLRMGARFDGRNRSIVFSRQSIVILVCRPIRRNSRSMDDFVIETQPAVGEKLCRARCRNTALPRPAIRGAAL